jgi:Uma2 family endonuclease
MAAGSLVSVDQYLRTNYDPDRDFVDGELLERNPGEKTHGRLQGRIMAWMYAQESSLNIQAVVEVRLRINAQRFRIPDVMILSGDAPHEEVVVTPPLLCIEILSSRDTVSQMWKRTLEYLAIGVPHCWIIDPKSGEAWRAHDGNLIAVKDGVLRAGSIAMPLSAVLG